MYLIELCSSAQHHDNYIGAGMVAEVLPRRSELSDPAIANVDQIVLVFAAADPPFDPPNVTRFLVTVEQVIDACTRAFKTRCSLSFLHAASSC